MSLYRNILKQALKITWRYKYLWFFGLFASVLGSGGEYQIINNILNGNTGKYAMPNLSNIAQTGVFSKDVFNYIAESFKTAPATMTAILLSILFLIAFALFIVWLMTISQATLVNDSAEIIKRTKGKINVRQSFSLGSKKFWPVFGFNILAKFLTCLLFFLIGLPLIFSSTSLAGSIIYLILFILLVPTAIILSFIIKYAIAFSVIDNNKFLNSLRNGWNLFLKNWLVSIEMALVLFLINFLAGVSVILVILILAIPLFFLALLFSYVFSFIAFWLALILTGTLFLIIIILSGSILTTFQTSSWTGLFLELKSKGGTSKIIRLAENFNK